MNFMIVTICVLSVIILILAFKLLRVKRDLKLFRKTLRYSENQLRDAFNQGMSVTFEDEVYEKLKSSDSEVTVTFKPRYTPPDETNDAQL